MTEFPHKDMSHVMRTPAANEKQPYRRKHTQSGIAEQAGLLRKTDQYKEFSNENGHEVQEKKHMRSNRN